MIKIHKLNSEFPDEIQQKARVGQPVSIISLTVLDPEDRGRAKVPITERNEAGHFTVDSMGDLRVVRVSLMLNVSIREDQIF